MAANTSSQKRRSTAIPTSTKEPKSTTPVSAPRGRQQRLDLQVSVVGRGQFKPPGGFAWFPIGGDGSFVPIGSLVKMDARGKGGIVDGIPAKPGTLIDTMRKG